MSRISEFKQRFDKFYGFLVTSMIASRDIIYEITIRSFSSSNKITFDNQILTNQGINLYEDYEGYYTMVLDDVPSNLTESNLNVEYNLQVFADGLLVHPNTYIPLVSLGAIYILFKDPNVTNNKTFFNFVIRKIKVSDGTNIIQLRPGETSISIDKTLIYNYSKVGDLLVYDISLNTFFDRLHIVEEGNFIYINKLRAGAKIKILNSNNFFYFDRNISVLYDAKQDNRDKIYTRFATVSLIDNPPPIRHEYEIDIFVDGVFLIPYKDFVFDTDSIRILKIPSGSDTSVSVQMFHYRPVDVAVDLMENDFLVSSDLGKSRRFRGELAYLDYIRNLKDENNSNYLNLLKNEFILGCKLPLSKKNLSVYIDGRRFPQDKILASTNRINAFKFGNVSEKSEVYIQAFLTRNPNVLDVNQLNMFKGMFEIDTYLSTANFDDLLFVVFNRYLAELKEKLVTPDLPYYPYVDLGVIFIEDRNLQCMAPYVDEDGNPYIDETGKVYI